MKKCDVSSSIQFIYMKPIHNKCFLKAFYKKKLKKLIQSYIQIDSSYQTIQYAKLILQNSLKSF